MKRSKAAKPAAPPAKKAPASPKSSPASTKVAPPTEVSVVPYLPIGGGKAAEAIALYGKAFGAVQQRRMDSDGKVMHAELAIGKYKVFVADDFPSAVPKQASLHLSVPDADKWFERAVKAGCKVQMALADQFWGDRYGKVEDPFGHVWSIATTLEKLSEEEMAARSAKWMAENAHLMGGDKKAPSPAKAKPAPKGKKAAAKAAEKPASPAKDLKRTSTMAEAAAEGHKVLARNPPSPKKSPAKAASPQPSPKASPTKKPKAAAALKRADTMASTAAEAEKILSRLSPKTEIMSSRAHTASVAAKKSKIAKRGGKK